MVRDSMCANWFGALWVLPIFRLYPSGGTGGRPGGAGQVKGRSSVNDAKLKYIY